MRRNCQQLPFIKMHGAGNDYVFVDALESPRPEDPVQLARRISDRHTGIGSDGLIVLAPPECEASDVRMLMWNADGSRGHVCGNGIRCVALWMDLTKRTSGECRIQTDARTIMVKRRQFCMETRIGNYSALMGRPSLRRIVSVPLPSRTIQCHGISMGNPHAVIWTTDLSTEHVHDLGPQLCQHDLFPDGVNVEFAHILNNSAVKVRVWERGSGETEACGSGACAVVADAVEEGIFPPDTDVDVHLPGGILTIRVTTQGVVMAGPAAVVFEGRIKIN